VLHINVSFSCFFQCVDFLLSDIKDSCPIQPTDVFDCKVGSSIMSKFEIPLTKGAFLGNEVNVQLANRRLTSS